MFHDAEKTQILKDCKTYLFYDGIAKHGTLISWAKNVLYKNEKNCFTRVNQKVTTTLLQLFTIQISFSTGFVRYNIRKQTVFQLSTCRKCTQYLHWNFTYGFPIFIEIISEPLRDDKESMYNFFNLKLF